MTVRVDLGHPFDPGFSIRVPNRSGSSESFAVLAGQCEDRQDGCAWCRGGGSQDISFAGDCLEAESVDVVGIVESSVECRADVDGAGLVTRVVRFGFDEVTSEADVEGGASRSPGLQWCVAEAPLNGLVLDGQRAGDAGHGAELDDRTGVCASCVGEGRHDQGLGRERDAIDAGGVAVEGDVGDSQQVIAIGWSQECEQGIAADADFLWFEQSAVGVEQLDKWVESAADAAGEDVTDQDLAFLECQAKEVDVLFAVDLSIEGDGQVEWFGEVGSSVRRSMQRCRRVVTTGITI